MTVKSVIRDAICLWHNIFRYGLTMCWSIERRVWVSVSVHMTDDLERLWACECGKENRGVVVTQLRGSYRAFCLIYGQVQYENLTSAIANRDCRNLVQ